MRGSLTSGNPIRLPMADSKKQPEIDFGVSRQAVFAQVIR